MTDYGEDWSGSDLTENGVIHEADAVSAYPEPSVNPKVWVAFYFNGGFPRIHFVSEAFLTRLEEYLSKRPHLDIVIVRTEGEKK